MARGDGENNRAARNTKATRRGGCFGLQAVYGSRARGLEGSELGTSASVWASASSSFFFFFSVGMKLVHRRTAG